MRRLLLLFSVLLLGACWAVAQDSSSPSSSNPNQSNSSSASSASANSGQTSAATADQNSSAAASQTATSSGGTTVEGCLSGSSGNYTLSDKNGTTYQLTGDTAKLSEHVGHQVKVTGTSGAAAATASSDGTATGAAGASSNSQTLEVSSVKHIAKTCQSGSGMSK